MPEGSGRITLGGGAFDGPYSLRAGVEETDVTAGSHQRRPSGIIDG
jgi:hypothetical protein